MLDVTCPHCWQPVDIEFDPAELGPGEHRFVQDCDVCCHPLDVTVVVDDQGEPSREMVERE